MGRQHLPLEASKCDFPTSTQAAASACKKHCSKDESREVRDVHEFKPVQWKDNLNKGQLAQAQRIADKTLQLLVLGMRIREVSGEEACLYLSPNMKTLELEQAGESDGAPQKKRRVPVSEVIDASFGNGDKVHER